MLENLYSLIVHMLSKQCLLGYNKGVNGLCDTGFDMTIMLVDWVMHRPTITSLAG